MKILFVLEYYVPHIGGVEVLFQKLCEGLVERGHDVTVVTTRLPGTVSLELLNGVQIYRVTTPFASRYWFTFLAIPRVIKLASRADIIHTTTYNGAFPAWIVSKLMQKRCVITVHEVFKKRWHNLTGMNWLNAILHQWLEAIIINLNFNRYVAVSNYTKNCISEYGVAQDRIQVIYNGIDYELFNPGKYNGKAVRNKLGIGEEFIYMYYGRPGISKGLEYLIEAVPIVARNIADSKLLLILADDPKNRYEYILNMIKKLDIQKRIILLAPVLRDELPGYIAAADCVVVPSLTEGFGFSAAEACAMEKPVVVSNTASLPEVVSGQYVLVPPRSSEEIASGVENVYNKKMTVSEKKVFHWSKCIDSYIDVYNELLK